MSIFELPIPINKILKGLLAEKEYWVFEKNLPVRLKVEKVSRDAFAVVENLWVKHVALPRYKRAVRLLYHLIDPACREMFVGNGKGLAIIDDDLTDELQARMNFEHGPWGYFPWLWHQSEYSEAVNYVSEEHLLSLNIQPTHQLKMF